MEIGGGVDLEHSFHRLACPTPYSAAVVHNEGAGTWQLQPDRRVMYTSAKYPWLVAAYRFHNKVNMHSDWDLVNMDLPPHVFTPEAIKEKGQHYIVHYSSRSYTDQTYTDAIDVRIHPTKVPDDIIYGSRTGNKWGWYKTDHCQFINPSDVITPIRDATVKFSFVCTWLDSRSLCCVWVKYIDVVSLQPEHGLSIKP